MFGQSRFLGSMLRFSGPRFEFLKSADQSQLLSMTSYVGQLVSHTIQTKPSFLLSKRCLKIADLYRSEGDEAIKKRLDQDFLFRDVGLEYALSKLRLVRYFDRQSRKSGSPHEREKFYLEYIYAMIQRSCGNCIEVAILTHVILNFYFKYFILDDPNSSPDLKALRPVICGLNRPHDHAFNVIVSPPTAGQYSIDDICLVIDNWHERLLQVSPAEYEEHLSKSVDYRYIYPKKRLFDLKFSIYYQFNNPIVILKAIELLQKEGILPYPENKELIK